jgi:hypothetical protein
MGRTPFMPQTGGCVEHPPTRDKLGVLQAWWRESAYVVQESSRLDSETVERLLSALAIRGDPHYWSPSSVRRCGLDRSCHRTVGSWLRFSDFSEGTCLRRSNASF